MPYAPDMFQITVPPGTFAGATVMATAPNGVVVQAVVPEGVQEVEGWSTEGVVLVVPIVTGGLLPNENETLRDLALIGSSYWVSYVGFFVASVAPLAMLVMRIAGAAVALVGWPLAVTVVMLGVAMCTQCCERGEGAGNKLPVATRAALLFLRVLAANGELGACM